MSTLEETWKKLQATRFEHPGKIPDLRSYSHHPVHKLIRAFKATLYFIVAFLIIFLTLIIIMPQPLVKILMSVVLLAYVWGFWVNRKMLQRITALAVFDRDVLSNLKMIHTSTTSMLAFQRKAALYFYPVAATAGFTLGLSIEGNAAELLSRWQVQLILLVVTVVLVPLGYYFALWLEKLSFGKMLNEIDKLIREMSEEPV